mgnify:FL=1
MSTEPRITREWLREQLTLAELATPGPWIAADDAVRHEVIPEPVGQYQPSAYRMLLRGRETFAFIASARTNFPMLLRWALERVEK